jgi:DNA-damage-inducible protein D
MSIGIVAKEFVSPFDSIRHLDNQGNEFWYARDLQSLLGYANWQNFTVAIGKAKISFQTNPMGNENDNFIPVSKDSKRLNGKGYTVSDFKLSRYFCYLIAMNGDVRKPEIASAQAYFAVKTRQAETITAIQSAPELSRLEILRMALDSEEKRIEAENKLAIASEQIKIMAPLAKLGECMTTRDKDTKSIGEIAQSYGVGLKTFFRTLRDIKFIQQDSTRPYQRHIDAKYCEVKMVARPHSTGKLDPVCVVTMKGQAYIAKKLSELEKMEKAEALLEKTVALA